MYTMNDVIVSYCRISIFMFRLSPHLVLLSSLVLCLVLCFVFCFQFSTCCFLVDLIILKKNVKLFCMKLYFIQFNKT